MSDLSEAVQRFQCGGAAVTIAALTVVSVIGGWWLTGRPLRPLHRITATAWRLSLSNLHERIALAGPRDELKELADTFDAMLERLERSVESQRRFAVNASHELRTPPSSGPRSRSGWTIRRRNGWAGTGGTARGQPARSAHLAQRSTPARVS